MDELRGDWEGRFAGTNAGRIYLRLTPVPDGTVAEVKLDDDAIGPAYLIGTGRVDGEQLKVLLAARDAAATGQFGTVEVTATLNEQQELRGQWSTTVGTSGEFLASRAVIPPAPEVQASAQVSRFGMFEKHARTRACAVNIDVLRRVHSILRAAAEEAAGIHERKQYASIRGGLPELARLYRVTLLIRGAQGEVTATDDPATIDPESLPHPLTFVEFRIGFNYRATTGNEAPNRAVVSFDFTRPPPLDLSSASGTPTPNNSSISAFGADTLWVAGVFERVSDVVRQNAVPSFWLHRARTYDVLLVALGLPFSLTLGVLAASRVPSLGTVNDLIFRAAVGLFTGILALLTFKLSFSLTRWLLPYIEYAPSPEPIHRRVRVLLAGTIAAIVTGILGSALYALLQ